MCPSVAGIFAGLRRAVSRQGRVALGQPCEVGLVVCIRWVEGDEGVVGQSLHLAGLWCKLVHD